MDFKSFFQGLWADVLSLKTTDAWFSITRSGLSPLDWVFAGFGVVLLLTSILLWVCFRKQLNPIRAKFYRRWRLLLGWVGLFAIVWTGLRYQFVNVLGTRVALAVPLLVFLIQAGRLVKYCMGKMKDEQLAFDAQEQKLKYLRRS